MQGFKEEVTLSVPRSPWMGRQARASSCLGPGVHLRTAPRLGVPLCHPWLAFHLWIRHSIEPSRIQKGKEKRQMVNTFLYGMWWSCWSHCFLSDHCIPLAKTYSELCVPPDSNKAEKCSLWLKPSRTLILEKWEHWEQFKYGAPSYFSMFP